MYSKYSEFNYIHLLWYIIASHMEGHFKYCDCLQSWVSFATILMPHSTSHLAVWLCTWMQSQFRRSQAIRQNRIKRQKANSDLIKRFASGQLQLHKSAESWGHFTQPTKKSIITDLTSPQSDVATCHFRTASQKARNNIAAFKAAYAIKIQHIAVILCACDLQQIFQ